MRIILYLHPSLFALVSEGYLRAVLSQPIFHCAALSSFLEIPVALLTASAAAGVTTHTPMASEEKSIDPGATAGMTPDMATAPIALSVPSATELTRNRSTGIGAESSTDHNTKDQWRKVYLHLRKNLKPREVAVLSPNHLYSPLPHRCCG